MIEIQKLISSLNPEVPVYIQTHNFPDHDAVASAFALKSFLNQFNIKSILIYEGEIQRDSLKNMIKALKIDIRHSDEYNLTAEDKIIIVDGCKHNKNVTDLIGDEIAVIDHHNVDSPDDVPFCDIRSDYGACSSVIFSYFQESDIEITHNVATALMIGINMDTALLTRDVSSHDVAAYSTLYSLADMRLVNTILRNYIQVKDLKFYKDAINNLRITRNFAFCYFKDGCNQNLLGILGDFVLSLKEIDFAVLCAENNGKINFSIRNENPEWNAAAIVETILQGIGFGGGHTDMAGGIITNLSLFNENDIYNRFLAHLNIK
ncbi:MAG: DHH family phosphoesterase [Spirochaetes bacterium]|nr:DHH family phosphoesterase [Spirochaetota bacterium]